MSHYKITEDKMDVNQIGPFLVCKAAYPFLKKAEYGRVINIASIFSNSTVENIQIDL